MNKPPHLPVKYISEFEQRVIELVLHAQPDPDIDDGTITNIADELSLSKESLRVWVHWRKCSESVNPAESIDFETENHGLRAELAEAECAAESLKKSLAFSPGDPGAHRNDRPVPRR